MAFCVCVLLCVRVCVRARARAQMLNGPEHAPAGNGNNFCWRQFLQIQRTVRPTRHAALAHGGIACAGVRGVCGVRKPLLACCPLVADASLCAGNVSRRHCAALPCRLCTRAQSTALLTARGHPPRTAGMKSTAYNCKHPAVRGPSAQVRCEPTQWLCRP